MKATVLSTLEVQVVCNLHELYTVNIMDVKATFRMHVGLYI